MSNLIGRIVNFYNMDEVQFFKDGEYFFRSPNNFSFNLVNFNDFNSKNILVCFNAAVSDRANKTGPFYSGIGLANQLKIPTISFSDFVVTNSNDISLAWYGGDELNTDFQNNIAKFLDRIANFLIAGLSFLVAAVVDLQV